MLSGLAVVCVRRPECRCRKAWTVHTHSLRSKCGMGLEVHVSWDGTTKFCDAWPCLPTKPQRNEIGYLLTSQAVDFVSVLLTDRCLWHPQQQVSFN